MANEDQPVTLAQLKALVGAGGNSGPASGSGASPSVNTSGLAKSFDQLTTTAAGASMGFVRLTQGTDAAHAGLNLLTSGLNKVGLSTFSGALGEFGGALLKQKDNLDKASAELGIGGNNIGLFVRMAGDAGLTTQQFTEVIKRADGGINSLGITAQQSAVNFSKIQKNIVETGDALNKMGISAEEQAEITALATQNDFRNNANTKAGQAAIAKSAVDLAMSLDETSKLTGQSRDAIAKSIKAEESKPEAIIATLNMTAAQKKGFDELQATTQKMGPGVQSMVTELANGGIRTKEGMAMMQAMGPEAFNKFKEANNLMLNARTDADKQLARAKMDEAQAAMQNQIASNGFRTQMLSGTDEQKAATRQLVAGYKEFGSIQGEMNRNGGDALKAIKDSRDAARATQDGMEVDAEGKRKLDKDGNEIQDKGQQLAQDLNKANQAAAVSAGGVARNFEKLNTDIVKTPGYIQAMNAAMNKISGGAGTGAGAIDKATANYDYKKIGDQISSAISGPGAASGPTKTKGTSSLPKDYQPTEAPGRDGGTLAKTGSAVEPQDAIVKIHKGETVLSPEATKGMGKQLSDGSKAPSAADTAAEISTVPAATGAKTEPAAKVAPEAPAKVSDDQKKIVDEFKNSSSESVAMFANAAKRGMKEHAGLIAEHEETISSIRKKAADQGRELTTLEQNRIGRQEQAIAINQKGLEEEKTRFETLSNFENIKKQIAQEGAAKAIDAKKSEVAETVKSEEAKKNITTAQAVFAAQSQIGYSEGQKKMFAEFFDMSKEDSEKKKQSLAEEEASAQAVNIATAKARDAIEEKAELENREMTESEKAQYASLTAEMNASAKRMDIARDAQKVLEKADEEKAFSAKIAANEEANAKEIAAFRATQLAKDSAQDQENIQTTALAKTRENVNETLTINGKVVDPNSAEGKAALGKLEEAKAKMNQVMGGMMPDMSKMMASGGKMTVNGQEVDPSSKQGQAAMQMMGPEVANKFRDAVSAMQSATTADEKAKAKLQMDEAQSAIEKRTQDREFQQLALTGNKEQQEAAKLLLQKTDANQGKPSAPAANKTEATTKAVESHTIKAGETLSKIAKEAGISVQDIMKANPNIKDPNKIAAGASLNIPGAKKVEEAKPKTTEEKKPETDATKKVEEAKLKEAEKKPGEVGYVSEQAAKLTSGFDKIGGAKTGKGEPGGGLFHPKVINKLSDEEWAKVKEQQKTEAAKTSDAAPKTTATGGAPKTSDAAPKKDTEAETKAKQDAEAKAKADAAGSKSATSTEAAKPKSAEPTLKDLNDQLIMLNRHMVELIKHSSATADASNKTAKTTAKASGRAY